MLPAPGLQTVRHVGDTLSFSLQGPATARPENGWHALLRTNLGRSSTLHTEIIHARTRSVPPSGASWHDVPLHWDAARNVWSREFVLTEPGYHSAKAYIVDAQGYQHWPAGPDFGVSIHPDWCRTANTLYCAFTRLFGDTRTSPRLLPESSEASIRALELQGFAVIPPSGTFRDLARCLPHIVHRLGCRILHLLPVHPTPTVHARFGRAGSPYAALDLTAVDPALVEFDRATTGIDQFMELTRAAHGLGARVFIDIVINHTGWGSRLFEENPEFFRREADGRFACPGAWGVVWEDLVELEQESVALWETIAESLLTWCRRGVDGFRCDAGYKVPTHVWQFITARVTREFPDTVFLLEGLGGSWQATESLLGPGGMQWAYSELFQNHSGAQVQSYLDYALDRSATTGTYVHYSETHDNDRLGATSKAWSLLRNRLCALTSVKGGFGFTAGVEWLASEKILVHQRTGLAWDSPDNIVAELARLNLLLGHHPAFFDGARLQRLSPPGSTAFALRRSSPDGQHTCLVLANTSPDTSATLTLKLTDWPANESSLHDLLGQELPRIGRDPRGTVFHLPPASIHCLGDPRSASGESGDAYREFRARAAFAVQTAAALVAPEKLVGFNADQAAEAVDSDPSRWLASITAAAATPSEPSSGSHGGLDLRRITSTSEPLEILPRVATWQVRDARRVLIIPPGWWLLLRDDSPFRVTLEGLDAAEPEHRTSLRTRRGHVAAFAPRTPSGPADARITFEIVGNPGRIVRADIRFLSAATATPPCRPPVNAVALLTNGRGAMARLRMDFGAIASKYDCALAANLHPSVPVDRHVFVKRIRAWLNADGFLSPLDRHNLVGFEAGSTARWNFRANAGDGRTVEVRAEASFVPGRNTTRFCFRRAASDAPHAASLTLRVDIEDRSFHSETHRNPDAERHFQSNTVTLPEDAGFTFHPAPGRELTVRSDRGLYHAGPEWAEPIAHPVEASRGQTSEGDAYSPGWFEIPLRPGDEVTLTLDAELQGTPGSAPTPIPEETFPTTADSYAARLQLAIDAFVVRRDAGRTVIAGYPWFLDWGRDTLIAARGLLAAGRASDVLQILETFAPFADRGTLPNSIHGTNASNRDTSDAPLWFVVVVEETAHLLGTEILHRRPTPGAPTLLEVVRSLADGYLAGTPNGIRVDPNSALVWSPSHFTWMDTNHPAGTPREGYPIEIQALWIRTLRWLAAHDSNRSSHWDELALKAHESVQELFWLPTLGWFSDVLVGTSAMPAERCLADDALRCNQLLFVAFGLATPRHARSAVDAAMQHLVVPGAVRTLAPLPVSLPLPIRDAAGGLLNDPTQPYWGRYEGDEDTRRKPAYHNGTAWTWFLPLLCEAMAVAWDFQTDALTAARAILKSNETLLDAGCIGHLPEILDGDAPHSPRGCDAQAWSVTESLRVWHSLNRDRTADRDGCIKHPGRPPG